VGQQPQQQPAWGQPSPQPPKPKRQFTVTKIAIGVAAGIALFIIGSIVLIAVLLSSGSTSGKHATAAAPVATEFTPPPSAPPADSTPPASVEEVPTNEPANAAIGDTVTITEDGSEAATVTVKSMKSYRSAVGEFGEDPVHGRFVVVTVELNRPMSMGSGSFDYSEADWYVRSEDGSRYDQTDGNALMNEFGQLLDSGTLHPGDHVKGLIAFDVPKGHGWLVYAPGLDDVGRWRY